jgi:hypothetical protein
LVHQAPGDLVLLPFNAPHQVFNTVGRSVKFSWNIQTPASAEASIRTVLPVYRNLPLPRPEVYRMRLAAYWALQQRVNKLETLQQAKAISDESTSGDPGEEGTLAPSPPLPPTMSEGDRQGLEAELGPLIKILADVLDEEALPIQQEVKLFTAEEPQGRVCDICRCDIFNRTFHAKWGTKAERNEMEGDGEEEDQGDLDFCLRCIADMRPLPKGVQKRSLQIYEHIPRGQLMGWLNRANAVMPAGQTRKAKPSPTADAGGKGSTLAMQALYYVNTTVHCHMCRKKYVDDDSLIGCGVGSCRLKYCQVCFGKHNVPFERVKDEVEGGRSWECFK